ncbi:integrase family protein [Polynucleobacter sp. AP-Sving-400A-A2]|uniref:tyrosine-type recombinase/integrase n=1 Tax=Polynucleobacter sp. AP-Sving-400A-A2 TaxID=2081049 RepID=UPI001BFE684A|nr:integrase family protein [Polynucleobacter sp. AP-Sving-400A-A2]QWE15042.1 integrase family protein [Polynucleobacter sp. AP-Sving-400A-A2]
MQEWVKDKTLSGLYKRIRDTGDVWVVKARQKGGNPISCTIGKTSLFTAQQARQKAKVILALLAEGVNPNQLHQQKKQVEKARALTLGKAIEQYSKIASWKSKTRSDAISTLNRRFGDWLQRPLASITKEECQARFIKIKEDVRVLKVRRDAKRKKQGLRIKEYVNEVGLGEAQRAFRYLGAIFSSYSQDDAGDEKLLPKGNPCLILKAKKLRKVLVAKERFLDSSERNALCEVLTDSMHGQYQGSLKDDDVDLVWLLIHTGLRLDEALSMRWSDVNFKKEIFTALNTKNGSNHSLPMTNAIKAMLSRRAELSPIGIYVFPSPLDASKPSTASRTFQRLSESIGFEFTAHDLRRTVATVANELGYDINAIGAVLNHAKKGVTAGYVQNTHLRLKRILDDIQNGLFEEPYDLVLDK